VDRNAGHTGGLATGLFIGLIAIGAPTKTLCRGFGGGPEHCTTVAGQSSLSSILEVAVFALLVLAPVATSVYLARRAA
jgi:hypothetical protein